MPARVYAGACCGYRLVVNYSSSVIGCCLARRGARPGSYLPLGGSEWCLAVGAWSEYSACERAIAVGTM